MLLSCLLVFVVAKAKIVKASSTASGCDPTLYSFNDCQEQSTLLSLNSSAIGFFYLDADDRSKGLAKANGEPFEFGGAPLPVEIFLSRWRCAAFCGIRFIRCARVLLGPRGAPRSVELWFVVPRSFVNAHFAIVGSSPVTNSNTSTHICLSSQ